MADIKKIQVGTTTYDISVPWSKVTDKAVSVGDATKPVYINASGEPTACNFKITYGAIGSRPATGTEGQIYFVV